MSSYNTITHITPGLFEDPQLERQVEVIRTYVNSYMTIVRKTFKDIVPKHIMCLMVNKMQLFIEAELMPALYGAGNPVSAFLGFFEFIL